MSRRPGRSRCPTLSGRLVLLFVVMAALIVIVAGVTMGWAFRGHFEESIRPHLMRYLEYVQNDLGTPPQLERAQALVQRLPVEISYVGRDQRWSTADVAIDADAIHFNRQFSDNGIEYGFGHSAGREFLVSRHDGYSLIFSVPRQSAGWYRVIPVVIILLTLVLLYHATRRLFAPIEQIKYGVERIGGGDLAHRIDVRRRDELGELGRSINAMAEDIQKMLDSKRQLLLAISHELRSPLTRAKVAVEMIDDARQREEIHRDLNEMEALIAGLLETERLSSNHATLNRSDASLNELITAVVSESFSDAQLQLDLPPQSVKACVDVARIRLLLKNLIDNALRHNPNASRAAQITLNRSGGSVLIKVRDFGQGIAADQLPYLAQPFYRVDAARQRQTGGYGLGLYLCRMIAEAHGGCLVVEGEAGAGTVVVVQLPLTVGE